MYDDGRLVSEIKGTGLWRAATSKEREVFIIEFDNSPPSTLLLSAKGSWDFKGCNNCCGSRTELADKVLPDDHGFGGGTPECTQGFFGALTELTLFSFIESKVELPLLPLAVIWFDEDDRVSAALTQKLKKLKKKYKYKCLLPKLNFCFGGRVTSGEILASSGDGSRFLSNSFKVLLLLK